MNKTCAKCLTEKNLSFFSSSKSSKDDLHAYCRECNAIVSKMWREMNRERATENRANWEKRNNHKVVEYQAKHYAKHSVRVLEKQAKHRANNPDQVRGTQERYYLANKENKSAYAMRWRKDNKLLVKTYNHARRASMVGRLSKNIVDRLFNMQCGKCVYCGVQLGINYHLDHRMPLSLGGLNIDDNIQLLCRTCNLQKGAKHPDEFIRQRGLSA